MSSDYLVDLKEKDFVRIRHRNIKEYRDII